MMNQLIALTIVVVICLSSCENKSDQITVLKDEVMAVHDEVMPMMGDLRKTAKSLEMKAETMDSVSAAELRILASNIEAANEFMMDWMRQYEPDLEGTEQELLEYYSAQRESVQVVNDSMKTVLQKGKAALK